MDNPIEKPKEDELGRLKIAAVMAQEIRSLDISRGCVVGVLGPWGSGKTSLINLMRAELAKDPALPVLDFNPWMFSGTEELVERFFGELADQLKLKSEKFDQLANIAESLEAYSEAIAPLRYAPLIGSWVERARGVVKVANDVAKAKKQEPLYKRREHVVKKLNKLTQPIVVIIDDIDRLSTQEIRDIFRLVRLTANFPNVIYVLAFDRERVERALDDNEAGLGRKYLDKIVQLVFDVPVIPDEVLSNQITSHIDAMQATLEKVGPFDEQRWPDVFFEVINPLISTMRDVRRYVSSTRGTLRSISDQVSFVDVLALEAARIFMPDMFGALVRYRAVLTDQWSGITGNDRDITAQESAVKSIVEAAGRHKTVAKDLIRRVFPGAERFIQGGQNIHYGPETQKVWRKDRRVAHPDMFDYYLEQIAGEGLISFTKAEQAFGLFTDQVALDKFFNKLPPDEVENVIAALETYEMEYPLDAVVPASAALLNQLARLKKKPANFLKFDGSITITRVVLRLLRRLEDDKNRVGEAVERILARLPTLSARFELLRLVGYEDGAGHKMISEILAQKLEKELRDQIRTTPSQKLATERELLALLWWVKKSAPQTEPVFELKPIAALDKALLINCVTQSSRRTLGNRAQTLEDRLYWDFALDIMGSEANVRTLVLRTKKRTKKSEDLAKAINLFEKYLSGWRPE